MQENILNSLPAITPDMVSDMKSLCCSHCGCDTFKPVIKFKKVSPLLTRTGKEELYPLEYELCNSCGYISPLYESDEVFLKMIGFSKKSFSEKNDICDISNNMPF